MTDASRNLRSRNSNMPASSVASTSGKLPSKSQPNSKVRNILNKSTATPTLIPDIAPAFSANDIDVNTDGLSEESKKLVACIIRGVVSHFEDTIGKRDKMYEDKLSTLQKRIDHLEEKIDEQENYQRRETLVMSGSLPAFTDRENTSAIVIEKLTQLGLAVKNDDVSISHRLGKKPTGEDKRSIIFKLCRREMKAQIIEICKRKRPENLYINESVSPTRSSIMYALRKARQEFPTKFGTCRTEEGNIRLWLPKSEQPTNYMKITVNTRNELYRVMLEQINYSSDRYNISWR